MSINVNEYCEKCEFNHIFDDSWEKLINAPCCCDCHEENK